MYIARVQRPLFTLATLLSIALITGLVALALLKITHKTDYAGSPLKSGQSKNNVAPTIIPVKAVQNINSGLVNSSGQVEGITYSMTLPPKHPGLSSSNSPELRKLAEYEQVSGGAVASDLMFFTDTPVNNQQAIDNAAYVVGELKEFAKFGITPIVIMEPTTNDGPLNYNAYRSGAYDAVLKTFFNSIKSQGITDQQMGMWVPFPEDNAPLWGNTDPSTFSANVTRTVQIQKSYFPGSQASILLNGNTYSSTDINWEHGVYSSLVPYVAGIPAGLINSFGLQGFPWDPPRNGSGNSISDASIFLPESLTQEVAKSLGVKKVWFNTGTYQSTYDSNKSQSITISPQKRQQILDTVILQGEKLRNSGYDVAINLFCADKSTLSEATDWSYWHDPNQADDNRTVFLNFVGRVYQSGFNLWLFDSYQP